MKHSGARGLFVGYGSFLLRDLPFDAIEFSLYEELKSKYVEARVLESRKKDIGRFEATAMGALATA